MTDEFDRICMLPTRGDVDFDNLIVETLRGPQWSGESLNDVQYQSLCDLKMMGGCVASLAVGFGKSLIGLLSASVVECHRPLYILPSSTIPAVAAEAEKWSGIFKIDERFRFFTYNSLSDRKKRKFLGDYRPDLVVLDEVHKLRNKQAARTKNFVRYMGAFPNTKVLAMSGTLTRRSVRDYAHIIEWALGKYSPVPKTWSGIETLSKTTDDLPDHEFAEKWQWSKVESFVRQFSDLDVDDYTDQPVAYRRTQAREALKRRLKETVGCVMTEGASVRASIRIKSHKDVLLPNNVWEAIERVRQKYVLPNDDLVFGPPQAAAAERQLASGFYYRRVWPDGERDIDWLAARRAWAEAVNDEIRHGPDGVNSEALVREAVQSGQITTDETHDAWRDWKFQRQKPEPETEAVWMCETPMVEAVRMATLTDRPCLIWYRWRAEAEKLAEFDDVVVCKPQGQDPQQLDGSKPVCVSQTAHRKGLNLQHFSENIVLCPSPSAQTFEQLIGRTHRQGQKADTVRVKIFSHTERHRASILEARENARYVQQSQGQDQKLFLADWTEMP